MVEGLGWAQSPVDEKKYAENYDRIFRRPPCEHAWIQLRSNSGVPLHAFVCFHCELVVDEATWAQLSAVTDTTKELEK